ncbi:hypothetical protein [Neoasaia chiangmaiensis]|uniref:hypothetical protein n=1 Tax=Neoasaia chiangmaiensis TaxID=320497 RepID=UPI0011BEBED1|nr:hypothetical protein [Neoasaia chiangmaiensis]
MANQRSQKKVSKSESLTIRLDPKMRFALEFVARLKGQTITKVIERAVLDMADRTVVEYKNAPEGCDSADWRDFWDVNEGIRALNMARTPETHPTFEEDEILDFVQQHPSYFFRNGYERSFNREYIDVLWPEIEFLLDVWRSTKSTNRGAVVDMMETALAKAGLETPRAGTPPII